MTCNYCCHVAAARKAELVTNYAGPVFLHWHPFSLGYSSVDELRAHILTTEHRPPFCWVGEVVRPSLRAEDVAAVFCADHNVTEEWLAQGAVPSLQVALNRWVKEFAPNVTLVLRARPGAVVELKW